VSNKTKYTKTYSGDKGNTCTLSKYPDGACIRMRKDSPQIRCISYLDNVDSLIELLVYEYEGSPSIQHHLSYLQGLLRFAQVGLSSTFVDFPYEAADTIDSFISALDTSSPTDFYRPKTLRAAQVNLVRTEVRIAETYLVGAYAPYEALKAINRMSEYLFVLMIHEDHHNVE